MLKLHAAVRRLIISWSLGQAVTPPQAKEAAVHFESGHVCRNCESQIMRLPDCSFYWCPTCGAESAKAVTEICSCGARVGAGGRDAQLKCVPVAGWAEESNLLVRRKVGIGVRDEPAARPASPRKSKSELFGDDQIED